MRYLLYKDYESGLGNNWISLELAIGLAYLTNRQLVYYGSVGAEKNLLHIRGGHYYRTRPHRQAVVTNQQHPTLLDLLDELPIKLVDYPSYFQHYQQDKLSIINSSARLVKSVFVQNYDHYNAPNFQAYHQQVLTDFAAGRDILTDVSEDIWHLHECNLGYYSRFFFLPPPNFYQLIAKIRPAKIYRDLANKISQNIGHFNGVHIRLTDFKKFLPQGDRYQIDILDTLQNIIPTDELLVICTDESENKDFFQPITQIYQKHLFLDELIIDEFSNDFSQLPFTDEQTLGLICNMIMWHSQQFVGTPGSTFSGLIHRHWCQNRLLNQLSHQLLSHPRENLQFRYINSGSSETTQINNQYFQQGVYVEHKPGFFTWNRIHIPRASETLSWYREWPEAVFLTI